MLEEQHAAISVRYSEKVVTLAETNETLRLIFAQMQSYALANQRLISKNEQLRKINSEIVSKDQNQKAENIELRIKAQNQKAQLKSLQKKELTMKFKRLEKVNEDF